MKIISADSNMMK